MIDYLKEPRIIIGLLIFTIIIAQFLTIYFKKNKENGDKSLTGFLTGLFIFYVYLLHVIRVKRECGLHTTFVETFRWGKGCFKYENGVWNKSNTNSIGNTNTDIINHKFRYITIYGLVVLMTCVVFLLHTITNSDEGSSSLLIRALIMVSLFLVFFIWTCVINFPIWIILLVIFTAVVVYLMIQAIIFTTKVKDGKVEAGDLCKPYIIPFVNQSWAGVSFNDNLNSCISKAHGNMFTDSIAPVIKSLGKIDEILAGQGNMITELTSSLSFFRDQMKKMAIDIYNKIEFIINKIKETISTVFDIFYDVFKVFMGVLVALANLSNSFSTIHNILKPVLKVFEWFCFDGNTLIKTRKGEIKIKNIKVNDIIEDGSKVLGVLKFKYNKCDMYNYKGVIVSDSHYVFEDKWIKIKDSKIAKKIEYNKKYIYCLITDTNKIKINNITFSDYFDYPFNQTSIQNKILTNLNKFRINNMDNNIPLYAFHKDTYVATLDGKKKISEFKIDDKTKYGKVVGISQILVEDIYKYRNVITSGHQIVKHNDIYLRVKDISEAEKIECKDNVFYNISDTSLKLSINNMLFTDFLQE